MMPTHAGKNFDSLTGFSGQTNPQLVLRPCPFCGGKVVVFTAIYGIHGASDYYAIAHPDDNDCIIGDEHTMMYEDKEELIHDWNRRVNV